MTERQLPSDVLSERMILGSILVDQERMGDARQVLTASDFTVENNRRIWGAMTQMYDAGRNIDRITTHTKLKSAHPGESWLTVLLELEDGMPRVQNIDSYIGSLLDKTALRRILAASHSLEQRCYSGEPVQSILDGAHEALATLTPCEQGAGWSTPKDVIADIGIDSLLSGKRTHGIRLPWVTVDRLLAGLHPEQLITIAGAPSSGKTSAALQIAATAAHYGTGVALFNLEMSKRSLVRRMIHQEARSAVDQCRLRGAVGQVAAWQVYLDDRVSCTTPAIHAAIRKLRLKCDIGLVIVDFLQILGSKGHTESRNLEVGANSRSLKLMAKEFGVPVIMLSSLSRDPSKDEREPKLSDLRDSGEIEFNSDVVLFIHPRKGGTEAAKLSRFTIAKQREGPRDVWVDMIFMAACQRFEEEADEPEDRLPWSERD
jgi:replicative DNA helicase